MVEIRVSRKTQRRLTEEAVDGRRVQQQREQGEEAGSLGLDPSGVI